MKPFTQVATPHEDIIEGRLTLDVFAADLWQVVKGRAPADYQDRELFFRKTYLTKGLKNIIEIARNRLEGKSGDSVVQLQTPFGGGKTHTLIALYHKAREWNAKVVVFDGTAFDPKDVKPWEEVERQLTGKVELTKGDVAPGKEKLLELISNNAPVLILMDELLEYTTKAGGIRVAESNLASQTMAFVQELTGAVSTVKNAFLVVTLPSSILEHYDENAERLFQQLQRITGRMERIYTPVEEEEINHVVRRRLFQSIDQSGAKKIVDEFVDYAKGEGLLSGEDAIRYRERFLESYPFKPEVIDVLYKRWGSYPAFQRTRGVLRLLSIVVHDLLDKNIPFIRLGDFNLKNEEIKRELLKCIGQEFDSIMAQDITSEDSGAKRIDKSIGSAYKPYNLGTVVGITIFMYSFSGKGEQEGSTKEVKLASTLTTFSSTVIDTVISQLREQLFYLSDEGLYFTNQPNINRILIIRKENISLNEMVEEEMALLRKYATSKTGFLVYIWPANPRDVPDTAELKLVILRSDAPIREFVERYGESPRIYRNTMILLCSDETGRERFNGFIKDILALRAIERDDSLNLTEGQKREIKAKLTSYERRAYEELRKCYRRVFVPAKDGFKEVDLGHTTIVESSITSEVYNRLRSEGELLERLSPKVILEKYLAEKDYVETTALMSTFWKTPGEMRIVSADVFKECIKEGVERGLFGLGWVEGKEPECKFYKESTIPELTDTEVIIKPELCKREAEKKPTEKSDTEGDQFSAEPEDTSLKEYTKIHLRLDVPIGQMSSIVRIVQYLKTRFEDCGVTIEITAQKGKISSTDYENRIEEAVRQAGIEVMEERKE